jgi:L-ascorbate metabolism protein UlaG (beta-lactamase superfamily)
MNRRLIRSFLQFTALSAALAISTTNADPEENLADACVLKGTPSTRRASVTITYVANMGVLIAGPEAKVLVDSMFTESYGIFQVPSADALRRLQEARAPFDGVTCALATHDDGDHFAARVVLDHLLNDSSCSFAAPAEAISLMEPLPRYADVRRRVHAVPPSDAPIDLKLGSLIIRAVPLEHMERPPSMPRVPYNLGYIFSIGDIRFLHAGDMGPSNLAAIQRYNLRSEAVDVLIVNWYLFRERSVESARAIIGCLRPRLILLTHLTPGHHREEATQAAKISGLPPIIPLETPMQTYVIQREGSGLRVGTSKLPL